MTLKVRLTMMMVVMLVAVLALQYLLMERDRQETMSRLTELGSGLDRTTALFVEEARDLSRSPREDGLSTLLRSLSGEQPFSGDASVTVVVWTDSTHVTPLGEERVEQLRLEWYEGGIDSFDVSLDVERSAGLGSLGVGVPALLLQSECRDSIVVEAFADGEHRRIVEGSIGSDSVSLALADSLLARAGRARFPAAFPGSPSPSGSTIVVRHIGTRGAGGVLPTGRVPGRGPGGGANDVIVNLPLPGAAPDSFLSVQVRYPLDAIQEELADQRRRSLLWLGTVLGVGVFGAFLVAGQFTRPIRALQTSFRRVEDGDLSVHVEPERRDEIGRLTGSFNEMVDRLRESREVEVKLGEAERLATVGRLAAGVAHEIRNPLNAIQLTALQMRDVAVRGREDVDPTRAQLDRYYQLVSNEVQRLESLVSAFLDLTRDEELAATPLDGAQSLSASVELFRPEAEARGVRIEMNCVSSVPILADPARLPAVWNNLLSNALAASSEGATIQVLGTVDATRPDGDRVAVSGAPTSEDGGRRVGSATDPGEFVVVVTDSGPGVPPGDRPRIWEPFFSGRAAGTGLGLSIVRAVVERHRGSVRLLDREDGASFEVRIPRAAAEPMGLPPERAVPVKSPGRSENE